MGGGNEGARTRAQGEITSCVGQMSTSCYQLCASERDSGVQGQRHFLLGRAMEAVNLPVFLIFGKTKITDVCVVFAKNDV